jgi:hypothetical protein
MVERVDIIDEDPHDRPVPMRGDRHGRHPLQMKLYGVSGYGCVAWIGGIIDESGDESERREEHDGLSHIKCTEDGMGRQEDGRRVMVRGGGDSIGGLECTSRIVAR